MGQGDEGGWVDVGYGVRPWNALGHAIRRQSSARYFVAEHDDPHDFERFANRSIDKICACLAADNAVASS